MNEFIWPFGRGEPDTAYGTTAGDEAAIAELCHSVRELEIVQQAQTGPKQKQISTDRVLDLDDCR